MQSLDDLFDEAEDQAPPAAYNWEQEEEEQEGGNMLLMAGTGAGDEAVDLMVQDGNPLETLPLEEGGGGGGGAGLKKRRIQAPKYDASV